MTECTKKIITFASVCISLSLSLSLGWRNVLLQDNGLPRARLQLYEYFAPWDSRHNCPWCRIHSMPSTGTVCRRDWRPMIELDQRKWPTGNRVCFDSIIKQCMQCEHQLPAARRARRRHASRCRCNRYTSLYSWTGGRECALVGGCARVCVVQ